MRSQLGVLPEVNIIGLISAYDKQRLGVLNDAGDSGSLAAAAFGMISVTTEFLFGHNCWMYEFGMPTGN
jgi:hypothetical protein